MCGIRSRAARSAVARSAARGEHGEVVVLRHHGVGEGATVVAAAAVAHGLALEAAQPRRRLAGVDDARAGAGDRGDVAGGERGDARHPLHEVEADALGAQDAAGRPLHAGEHGAGRERVAVGGERLDDDRAGRRGGTPRRTRRCR